VRLLLQTDYALRVLLYLAAVDRRSTAEEMAVAYGISKDHLVKVIRQLDRLGYARTLPGRGGGVELRRDPAAISVGRVVADFEGRSGILDCVEAPEACPMEPGCHLRNVLMDAEEAFYAKLEPVTIADLTRPAGKLAAGLSRVVQLERFGGGLSRPA